MSTGEMGDNQALSGATPAPLSDSRAQEAPAVRTVRDLDLRTTVYVVTHGGCPDGQAAAFIIKNAVLVLNPAADVVVVQGAHSGRITPTYLNYQDSTIVFTDICPLETDSPAVEAARQVVVLDHHPTALDDLKTLKEKVGEQIGAKIYDLNEATGPSCAASLAQAFCDGVFAMNRDALEWHWKLDIFKHALPKDLEPRFNAFKGWVNQKGARSCELSFVEAFAEDPEACLRKGDEFYEPIRVNTRQTAAAATCVFSEPGLKVYAVDVDGAKARGEIPAETTLDPMVYQEEIDKLKEPGVAVGFISIERKLNPKTGAWNLALRRAGELVDMGKVSTRLREDAKAQGFVSGGGHAFAAGAQCSDPGISMEVLVRVVVAAMRASLT